MGRKRYRVEIKKSAERAYRKLPTEAKQRVASSLRNLELDPRPAGATKLKGSDAIYRVRTGSHRILYTIRDDVLIVLVIAIGHRRDQTSPLETRHSSFVIRKSKILQFLTQPADQTVRRDPDLLGRVAVAHGDRSVLQGFAVDGDAVRRADLVLPAVAAADGTGDVVV